MIEQNAAFDESIDNDESELKSENKKMTLEEPESIEGFSLEAVNDCILALHNFLSTKNLLTLDTSLIKRSELLLAGSSISNESDEEDADLKGNSDSEKYISELEQNFLFITYRTLIEALKKSANDGKDIKDFITGMLVLLRTMFMKVLLDGHTTKAFWTSFVHSELAVR